MKLPLNNLDDNKTSSEIKDRNIPSDVNQAAQWLLADLLVQHLTSLSKLSIQEFELLCEEVTPYLNEEFEIWEGNNALLESCITTSASKDEDPARVILNRVMQIIKNFHGYLVIT